MSALPINDLPASSGQPAAAIDEPTPGDDPLLPDTHFMLVLYADALDDMERTRIANENRLRALCDVKGLDGSPEAQRLATLIEAMAALEHGIVLDLQRAMRVHPLGPWIKGTVGIGLKQGARLLASIGDPYINGATGQPRTVSQLWAYCGYHVLHPDHPGTDTQRSSVGVDPSSDPAHENFDAQILSGGVAPKRRRGQKANWSSTAKMRAYLVAESCMKQRRSPYRDVYESRRTHTTTTHPDWSDGHSHNDALRVVAKAILRDLWIESRRLHEVGQ